MLLMVCVMLYGCLLSVVNVLIGVLLVSCC